MSIEAITWVLRHAPDLPPHLVSPLLVFANSADEHGHNAYPSLETVAFYTRKDRRATRRDVDKLEDLKLITRGEQTRVAHLPADRRPVVYNLPLERVCPDRVEFLETRKERRFARRPAASEGVCRPSRQGEPEGVQEPPREASEGVHETQREGLQDTSEGVPGPPDLSFDPSLEPSSLSARGSAVDRALAAVGIAPDEREIFTRWIEKTKSVRSPAGWIITAARNGTLPDVAAEWRASRTPRHPQRPPEVEAEPELPPEPCQHGASDGMGCDPCQYDRVAELYLDYVATGVMPWLKSDWRSIWDEINRADQEAGTTP